MKWIVPPAGLPMLSQYDRLVILYRYMDQMQMRKDRGTDWCELMEDIATQLAILSENTP
jgi:hypothetical protein